VDRRTTEARPHSVKRRTGIAVSTRPAVSNRGARRDLSRAV